MEQEKTSIIELRKLYSHVSIDPNHTVHLARKAQERSIIKGYIALSIEAYLLEAYSLNALGDPIEAIRLANKAYAIAVREESKINIARALNILSIVYFHSHQYDRGIRTIVHAMDYINEIDDHQLVAAIYNNLAEIYFASKDYYYANQYYEFALEQALASNDLISIKSIELNLAITQLKLGNKFDGKRLFKSALQRGDRESDPLTHVEIEYRLAMIYLIEGQIDLADELLKDSESVLMSVSNSLYLVEYYYHRALCDIRFSEEEVARYLNQALGYAQALDAKQKICDILQGLSDVYERSGQHELALIHYKRFHQLERELDSRNLITKLEILKEELDQNKIDVFDLKFEETLVKEIEMERMRSHRLHQANQELKKLAHLDELTGIPNRRGIKDHLSIYLNSNESLALYMIDIDHFKKFNDALGHLQGDACLIEISKLLSQHADHHSDFVGRYGGEEFLYIGRVSNFDQAHQRAENIRKLIENHQVKYTINDAEFQVTICVGGVFVNNSMEHHEAFLLNVSDQQLYIAKEEGRNLTKLINLS